MPPESAAASNRVPTRYGRWRGFFRDERAVTAVEYGLMVALISVTIMGAIGTVGQGLQTTLYGQIVTALANMSN